MLLQFLGLFYFFLTTAAGVGSRDQGEDEKNELLQHSEGSGISTSDWSSQGSSKDGQADGSALRNWSVPGHPAPSRRYSVEEFIHITPEALQALRFDDQSASRRYIILWLARLNEDQTARPMVLVPVDQWDLVLSQTMQNNVTRSFPIFLLRNGVVEKAPVEVIFLSEGNESGNTKPLLKFQQVPVGVTPVIRYLDAGRMKSYDSILEPAEGSKWKLVQTLLGEAREQQQVETPAVLESRPVHEASRELNSFGNAGTERKAKNKNFVNDQVQLKDEAEAGLSAIGKALGVTEPMKEMKPNSYQNVKANSSECPSVSLSVRKPLEANSRVEGAPDIDIVKDGLLGMQSEKASNAFGVDGSEVLKYLSAGIGLEGQIPYVTGQMIKSGARADNSDRGPGIVWSSRGNEMSQKDAGPTGSTDRLGNAAENAKIMAASAVNKPQLMMETSELPRLAMDSVTSSGSTLGHGQMSSASDAAERSPESWKVNMARNAKAGDAGQRSLREATTQEGPAIDKRLSEIDVHNNILTVASSAGEISDGNVEIKKPYNLLQSSGETALIPCESWEALIPFCKTGVDYKKGRLYGSAPNAKNAVSHCVYLVPIEDWRETLRNKAMSRLQEEVNSFENKLTEEEMKLDVNLAARIAEFEAQIEKERQAFLAAINANRTEFKKNAMEKRKKEKEKVAFVMKDESFKHRVPPAWKASNVLFQPLKTKATIEESFDRMSQKYPNLGTSLAPRCLLVSSGPRRFLCREILHGSGACKGVLEKQASGSANQGRDKKDADASNQKVEGRLSNDTSLYSDASGSASIVEATPKYLDFTNNLGKTPKLQSGGSPGAESQNKDSQDAIGTVTEAMTRQIPVVPRHVVVQPKKDDYPTEYMSNANQGSGLSRTNAKNPVHDIVPSSQNRPKLTYQLRQAKNIGGPSHENFSTNFGAADKPSRIQISNKDRDNTMPLATSDYRDQPQKGMFLTKTLDLPFSENPDSSINLPVEQVPRSTTSQRKSHADKESRMSWGHDMLQEQEARETPSTVFPSPAYHKSLNRENKTMKPRRAGASAKFLKLPSLEVQQGRRK